MLLLHTLLLGQEQERASYFNNDILPLFAQALPKQFHNNLLHTIDPQEIKEGRNLWYKYYFLQDDNNVVGLSYRKYKTPDTIYLNGFYIIPQYHRQWYGTKYLQLIENKLKKEWIEHFYGETNTYYDWAVAFYQKYWYEIIENNKQLNAHYLHKFYKNIAPYTIFFTEILHTPSFIPLSFYSHAPRTYLLSR